MKAANHLKDTVLEFSQTYFGEPEPGEGFVGHTRPANADRRPGDKRRREGVSPPSDVAFAAWGGWPNRGIPELASPLAD